ncbi:LAME_0F09604g1_1 [Lachancea meyersii CBS 8951]|uniref:LAME_0F09604g1_1 n=1 Tax=Lachancea meyersii CBS 8951 TaxID=1266667 RepID=A0A1G4JV52_9SACH|nr:LAME_0F09604g1_1 [Lachancea meyersii CBS 8951]
MLVNHDLPLEISQKDELPPDLSLLRKNAVLAVEQGHNSSLLNSFDVHLHFVNVLLRYNSEAPSPVLEDLACVAITNMAFFLQQVGEQLIQKAFTEDSKEAWASSGLYNKKAIGLLQLLNNLEIANSTHSLSLVQTYTKTWTLSQQLGVVMLSLSKLQSRVFGSTTKDSKYLKKNSSARYDRLLEFQESDLKDLAKSSLLYARLCIGCRSSCSQLANTSAATACEPLIQYLDSLTFILLSLDYYKNDDCGVAIGMLEAATDCLSGGLITSKQLKLIQETRKLKDRFSAKWNELKSESTGMRSKLNPFKKQSSPEQPGLHPFLQSTLNDFIIPLMMLLHYRYTKTNDKVFFQPIVRDRQTLRNSWPQGKAPEVAGTIWVFDGDNLREAGESAGNDYY